MTAHPAGVPAFGPPRGQSWHARFAATPTRRSPRLASRARVLAGLLVASLAVLGPVAPVQAAVPVPKVVIIVGPVGGVTDSYRSEADKAARVARRAGADVVTVYSPDATWSAVRTRRRRRVDPRLHGSRQRVAQPLSRLALSAHPERLRAEPGCGQGRRRPPVLRRGLDREAAPRTRRHRPPPPPVLRERQHRAGPPGRHQGGCHRPRGQLRRRVHPGRCAGGRRRGPPGAGVLRACPARGPAEHRGGVGGVTEGARSHVRARQRAQPGLHPVARSRPGIRRLLPVARRERGRGVPRRPRWPRCGIHGQRPRAAVTGRLGRGLRVAQDRRAADGRIVDPPRAADLRRRPRAEGGQGAPGDPLGPAHRGCPAPEPRLPGAGPPGADAGPAPTASAAPAATSIPSAAPAATPIAGPDPTPSRSAAPRRAAAPRSGRPGRRP